MYLYKGSNNFYSNEESKRLNIYNSNTDNKTRKGLRDNFERDYGRVIHSSSFRRLQGKTQVISIQEGDFHRTRLTHSMEVAQIARGITIYLNSKFKRKLEGQIDTSLIEVASLAHDLGHPPFGHKGERALHKKMVECNAGGFEGNAQTFRILTTLENDRINGLGLTKASLLSILKYPCVFGDLENQEYYKSTLNISPPKSSIYDEDKHKFEELLKLFTEGEVEYYTQVKKSNSKHSKTINKSFECSIVELADDIAYATHDLQDGIKLRLIDFDILKIYFNENNKDSIPEIKKIRDLLDSIVERNTNFTWKLKSFFADLIHIFINNIRVEENDSLNSPRLKYKAYMRKDLAELLDGLRDLTIKEVIQTQGVQTVEWGGGRIISLLFDALKSDKNLLPSFEKNLADKQQEKIPRIVCDYIAGMTDSYATRMFERLYGFKQNRLFDI